MKFVSFIRGDVQFDHGSEAEPSTQANARIEQRSHEAALGALAANGQGLVDLQQVHQALHGARHPWLNSLLALLDAESAGMELAARLLDDAARLPSAEICVDLSSVHLLSPVPRPRSIRDCLAFEEHLRNATATMVRWRSPLAGWIDRAMRKVIRRPLVGIPRVWYERPIYYKSNPGSVVGHNATVRWPRFSERLDYELEFGIYIGKRGKNIAESAAADYIAGYAIFNDFSARDIQAVEMQGRLGPAKSKDFDTGNAIGPWLTTPAELADPHALEMTARVNGETWSRGNSRDMYFSFEEIIAYISRDETLHPGDFIGSGTVGTGCGLELDRWIQPGDEIELEVEGLGMLRNRVERELDSN